MGFDDFISENEAARLASVSLSTLTRFAEAGYLKVERDHDGLRLFSKIEVEELFGVPKSGHFANSMRDDYLMDDFPSQKTESSISSPENRSADEPHLLTKVVDVSLGASSSVPQEPALNSQPATGHSSTSFELERARTLISLQEKLLDQKERELQDLKSQREWLQTRIERMEEKGGRDQILLLSETQTIRKLITIQEQRKGPFRAVLEWLGMPTSSPAVTSPVLESKEENGKN